MRWVATIETSPRSQLARDEESWGELLWRCCGDCVSVQPDYISNELQCVACDEAVQTLHTLCIMLSAADQASVCMQAGV